jgi:beta-aspartyl-peptidase (threonine type)
MVVEQIQGNAMGCAHSGFVRFSFAVAITALLAARSGLGNEAPANDVSEEIKHLLDAQAAAWNKGNLEAFMEGYWNSPELTFFSGKDITSGWQATLDRYRKRYQAEGREMGKLTFSDIRIVPAGSQDAWVRGRWRLVTSKETLEGLYTLILHKTDAGWKIVHDHTSAAPPPSDTKKPTP